ncbi:MAG TPA: hypothetical protein VGD81_12710 [Opitutaceae bacterium]
MKSSLLGLLTRDAVKVAELEAIYARQGGSPGFAADAIWAMRQLDADLAWRAVWLLKRHAREHPLAEADLLRIASCADEATHWVSRLTLCQMFSDTGWPASANDTVFPFLVESFANRRVIIRAWAVSALLRLKAHPKYREQVTAILRKARADSGKAMQARLRQLKKRNPS